MNLRLTNHFPVMRANGAIIRHLPAKIGRNDGSLQSSLVNDARVGAANSIVNCWYERFLFTMRLSSCGLQPSAGNRFCSSMVAGLVGDGSGQVGGYARDRHANLNRSFIYFNIKVRRFLPIPSSFHQCSPISSSPLNAALTNAALISPGEDCQR